MPEIFDPWPEKYDQWFETPVGRLVRGYERELILRMLKLERGEFILDAGCGTGVFTSDFLEADTKVVGLELSSPMLTRGMVKNRGRRFLPVQGDMRNLPFAEALFDKAVSVTAIEFIEEAKVAVEEMCLCLRSGKQWLAAGHFSIGRQGAVYSVADETGEPEPESLQHRSGGAL